MTLVLLQRGQYQKGGMFEEILFISLEGPLPIQTQEGNLKEFIILCTPIEMAVGLLQRTDWISHSHTLQEQKK